MTPLSVRQQDHAIKAQLPTFRLCLDTGWIAIWEGILCPITQPYRVRMTYFSRRFFPTCMPKAGVEGSKCFPIGSDLTTISLKDFATFFLPHRVC